MEFTSSNGNIYTVIVPQRGEGGNSFVHLVSHNDQQYALKILKKNLPSLKRKRFIREMEILEELKGTPSVIPIHDSYFPTEENDLPFYVMPVGIPILEFLENRSIDAVIGFMQKISNVLAILEEGGTAHRDIKPENIIIIDNEPYLADFGLAIKKSYKRLSRGEKRIGAERTIAPEMKRNPYGADHYLADAYSFAKMLWILLTKERDCFEGRYDTSGPESIVNLDIPLIAPLENMLRLCTSSIPQERFRHENISPILNDWISNYDDFEFCKIREWQELKHRIFGTNIPEEVHWSDFRSIYGILCIITNKFNKNHTYLPTGGGFDLTGIAQSHEQNCLELEFQNNLIEICKPARLSFYSPDDTGENDFFILDLSTLDPIQADYHGQVEYFTELSTLEYTLPECYDFNDYNGKDIPDGARLITRCRYGKYMVVMKASLYDKTHFEIKNHDGTYERGDAYSAIHTKVSEKELFTFIKKICLKESTVKDAQQKISPRFVTPMETKLRSTSLTNDQLSLVQDAINFFNTFPLEESDGISFFDLSSDDVFVMLLSERKHGEKITDFFDKYNDAEVQLIESLLYAGRDYRGSEFGRPLDSVLVEKSTRESNIRTLCEKSPSAISLYLENALKMYTAII